MDRNTRFPHEYIDYQGFSENFHSTPLPISYYDIFDLPHVFLMAIIFLITRYRIVILCQVSDIHSLYYTGCRIFE